MALLSSNESYRFGFQRDRDFLIEISMMQQKYTPIIGSLTLHPIVFYLLIFENRNMLTEVRIGYFFTYLTFVVDEWVFGFLYRIYPLAPYSALYCEGPLCTSGWNTQWLMALLSFPIIIANTSFDFLVVVMHQMFVPAGSILKLSKSIKVILGTLHSSVIFINILSWGIYGKECDQSDILKETPELAWLQSRGGKILMFGPPGEPQYFHRALILLVITQSILGVWMALITGDAMRRVLRSNSQTVSSITQAATRRMIHVFLIQLAVASFNYFIAFYAMFAFMVVDGSWIPGPILSFVIRFMAVTIYNTKSYVFGIFLLLKNPNFRKILVNKAKRIMGRESEDRKASIERTKTLAK